MSSISFAGLDNELARVIREREEYKPQPFRLDTYDLELLHDDKTRICVDTFCKILRMLPVEFSHNDTPETLENTGYNLTRIVSLNATRLSPGQRLLMLRGTLTAMLSYRPDPKVSATIVGILRPLILDALEGEAIWTAILYALMFVVAHPSAWSSPAAKPASIHNAFEFDAFHLVESGRLAALVVPLIRRYRFERNGKRPVDLAGVTRFVRESDGMRELLPALDGQKYGSSLWHMALGRLSYGSFEETTMGRRIESAWGPIVAAAAPRAALAQVFQRKRAFVEEIELDEDAMADVDAAAAAEDVRPDKKQRLKARMPRFLC